MTSKLPCKKAAISAPKRKPPISLSTPVHNDVGLGVKGKLKKKKNGPKKQQLLSKPEWASLPDLVLEDVFARLTIRDRFNASQVCRNWNRIFYSPRVWNTFVLEDHTLTRRKYNYYLGYQHVLDHYRTQTCLHRVGRGFRRLVITPMENFFNLYEFMTIVSYFCEFFEDEPLSLVRSLDFTFACDSATGGGSREQDEDVFGTGGKLLDALKRMMDNLAGLKHLSLQDLLLDKAEALYLLDDVAYNCCETLRSLKIVNCTKHPHEILHAGVFVNLRTLIISPQHLGEDVVSLLGYTRLRDLYLLQTKHTDRVYPVPAKVWKECKKISPCLKVHLKLEGKIRTELAWQEGAAVRSVIYDSPFTTVTVPSALACIGNYGNSLETYACLGLPRFYMPKAFQDRADSPLMLISRSCPRLETLVIRERVSTSTLLLIAHHSRSLRHLVVRRNAVVKRCDWPHNPEWSDQFYQWLRNTSRSYEATADEISRLLNCRWIPLNDREFKAFKL